MSIEIPKPKFNLLDRVRTKRGLEFEITYARLNSANAWFFGGGFVEVFPEDELTLVKPKRKITLYRYTLNYCNGAVEQSYWTSRQYDGSARLLKTETKTIEVDDE